MSKGYDIDAIYQDESSKECLASLYAAVKDRGGFREVIAEQRWTEVVGDVKWSDQLMKDRGNTNIEDKVKNARKVYEDFLFHFEKVYNEQTKFKLKSKKH